MSQIRVLRQRNWNEDELRAANFKYYPARKRLIMAKVIHEVQDIEITLEVLKAGAGDVICYEPSPSPKASLDDYEHWPVRRDLFRQNYKPWDERNWKPNQAETHLMMNGCRPYYKAVGVWAQRLKTDIYVQSLESPHPVLVPPGRWLCIGAKGEPYNMSDESFNERYVVTAGK
jgi:hypothetical protein